MTVLCLLEGVIPDEIRSDFIACLTSYTGNEAKNFVEHRIYLKNVKDDGCTYYLSRLIHSKILFECSEKDLEALKYQGKSNLASTWKLISLGRDTTVERDISLFPIEQFTFRTGDPISFLEATGFSYDYEMIRIGVEFIHPSGIRISIYSPLAVEKKKDLSSIKSIGKDEQDGSIQSPIDMWIVETTKASITEQSKTSSTQLMEFATSLLSFVTLSKRQKSVHKG
ncbi:uncharacterized protein MONOS_18632 [Monocercomonoides exilis]|uniref:uncharacterized protein n=1 Tax=Monocercomonoides exilis TaxID=2049356 RepID=UPI00355A5746|nr:hypothetical protein MONOS_18632 [Monocercomonoides exilis]